ncbi:MAG: IclR family transcriptional regulator [Pseudomonadota bacterium]
MKIKSTGSLSATSALDEVRGERRVDTTLAKGLLVLEALSYAPQGKGVTELSKELSLTKSNTYRLLQTLIVMGYVRPSESRQYYTTMKVWQVGQNVIDNLALPELAAPQLRRLSEQTGETIYLAVPDGLSVIYIDKIESTKPIRSWNPKGGSAPMHCVGTGKALLAASYETLRPHIKNQLIRYTDRTITKISNLDQDMAKTSKRRFAIDSGEFRDRIWSFGAAIHLPNGDAIAALGVSVPDVHLPKGRAEEICALIVEAADLVSESVAKS